MPRTFLMTWMRRWNTFAKAWAAVPQFGARFFASINTISHCLNFLDQTAALRFSPKWEDVRQLLVTRGFSAEQMILLSCDHAGGLDMCQQDFYLRDRRMARGFDVCTDFQQYCSQMTMRTT